MTEKKKTIAWVDIKSMDKAKILRDLYNAATLYDGSDSKEMTLEEAKKIFDYSPYLDVVRGRVLKVALVGDRLDPRWYDRHNGKDKTKQVVDALR